MTKRRKHRRVNLDSPPQEHFQKWQHAISDAESTYEHARGTNRCDSRLHYLNSAMLQTVKADAHLASALGSRKLGKQKTRWTNATNALRRKLAMEFDRVLTSCAAGRKL